MLAAGNRVIIKPSDLSPECGTLLKTMLAAVFPEDLVYVAIGGVDLAKEFSTLRWDHLLYTGSPAIGRLVMSEAAKNLVPVTLELGGKCPAIFTDDASVNETYVANAIGTKQLKNGQMVCQCSCLEIITFSPLFHGLQCITIDTIHVPRGSVNTFVELAKAHVQKAGAYASTEDCTGIISLRHLDRLTNLLDSAKSSGAEVISLEPNAEVNRDNRRMPLSIVVNPKEDSAVMTEEIFGPILPIRPFDSLDEAISYVNKGERPLALYVYGDDTKATDNVLTSTVSGGAGVNMAAVHGALPSLGFGGSGMSGMGRHHGIEVRSIS